MQIYRCVFVVLGLRHNKLENQQTYATVIRRINHSLQNNARNSTTHTKTEEFPLTKPPPCITDAVFSAMWFYSCHFPHNTSTLGKDFFPHHTFQISAVRKSFHPSQSQTSANIGKLQLSKSLKSC